MSCGLAAGWCDQVVVGIRVLRILVQILHVRVRRRAVEVEVVLFDVLAVIAFAVRETEEAFFQDRIFAIPERERETQKLLVVAEAGQAVLSPSVGAGACLIVREVVPGVAVLAVVLAHSAPLTFGKVRPPLFPRGFRLASFVQPDHLLVLVRIPYSSLLGFH